MQFLMTKSSIDFLLAASIISLTCVLRQANYVRMFNDVAVMFLNWEEP